MDQDLWAIEAYTGDEWILLPNVIMTTLPDVEFEIYHMRKSPEPYESYRIVRYVRQEYLEGVSDLLLLSAENDVDDPEGECS